jgi:hypothetical protein
MKKTILLIFSLLLIVLVLLGSIYYVKNVKNRTQVDASFSLKLPEGAEESKEFMDILKKANSDIQFFRLLNYKKDKQIIMSVSKYVNTTPADINEAFYELTAVYEPSNQENLGLDYKLLSYDSYKKEDKMLYTKVSSPFPSKCAIMFYFMHNNFSNELYELKLVGDIQDINTIKQIAETMALSVEVE